MDARARAVDDAATADAGGERTVTAAPSPAVAQPAADESETERRQLMDSALKVMRRNGFLGASVQDILDDAGLSTRAFYRQFPSKDDLLLAMFRTASGPDVDRVAQRVAAAASPRSAVEVWLDEVLAIAYDRKRIQRLVMFNVTARHTTGYDDEVAWLTDSLVAPLAAVLERGVEDGTFPDADPTADAYSTFDLVWSVASPRVLRRRPVTRAQARAHVLRFCLPGFGVRDGA